MQVERSPESSTRACGDSLAVIRVSRSTTRIAVDDDRLGGLVANVDTKKAIAVGVNWEAAVPTLTAKLGTGVPSMALMVCP